MKPRLFTKWSKYLAKKQGGWFCHYCRVPIAHLVRKGLGEFRNLERRGYKQATIDHKQAKVNGGTDDVKNLVLCCYDCNQRKQEMDYQAFVELIKQERGLND